MSCQKLASDALSSSSTPFSDPLNSDPSCVHVKEDRLAIGKREEGSRPSGRRSHLYAPL
jgi:hypothetical protein